MAGALSPDSAPAAACDLLTNLNVYARLHSSPSLSLSLARMHVQTTLSFSFIPQPVAFFRLLWQANVLNRAVFHSCYLLCTASVRLEARGNTPHPPARGRRISKSAPEIFSK
jgi:hypothetical protein